MRGWRTITSVVRTPCASCSSLAAALQQPCVSSGCRTPLRKRKQIAKKMNMSKIRCGSLATFVFRTAVLRCSILHREAAARNPEICRRGQVHGCRKADVTQALTIYTRNWRLRLKLFKQPLFKTVYCITWLQIAQYFLFF